MPLPPPLPPPPPPPPPPRKASDAAAAANARNAAASVANTWPAAAPQGKSEPLPPPCLGATRYINNKSIKYLLRAGHRDQAITTLGMFTKHDGDPMHNLKDMQVLWIANEYGFASLRAGEYGPALKKFLQVEQHFEDFIDDQFDFHGYCLRKMTLRAYVGALKMSDTVASHVAYQVLLFRLFFFNSFTLSALLFFPPLFSPPRLIVSPFFLLPPSHSRSVRCAARWRATSTSPTTRLAPAPGPVGPAGPAARPTSRASPPR